MEELKGYLEQSRS
uniref:Maturase K n=1 Tax=Philodendron amargalense TaxID=2153064 RepID=A0A483AKI1_9ARAE|nr:maturase K [Philodendron amargalense]